MNITKFYYWTGLILRFMAMLLLGYTTIYVHVNGNSEASLIILTFNSIIFLNTFWYLNRVVYFEYQKDKGFRIRRLFNVSDLQFNLKDAQRVWLSRYMYVIKLDGKKYYFLFPKMGKYLQRVGDI